jgi:hypothetical protein
VFQAIDIPGIPEGEPIEGTNYLSFLVVLKNLLRGKSVSIAAPASYWYLKAFPIKTISMIVDYIVYMTYDMHGQVSLCYFTSSPPPRPPGCLLFPLLTRGCDQWDYNNQWANPGCPKGNCLRSPVNLTETIGALVSINTKLLVSSCLVPAPLFLRPWW